MADTCKNGHPRTPENSYICAQGWRKCRICVRAGGARYRARHPKGGRLRTLSMEPLASSLSRFAENHVEPVLTSRGTISFTSGMGVVARQYALRFGGTRLAAQRKLARVSSTGRVSYELADELAILIGLHPALVWGEEWYGFDKEAAVA